MTEIPSDKLPPYLAVLSPERQAAIMKRAEEEGVPVEELTFTEGELDPNMEDVPEEQAETAESGDCGAGTGDRDAGPATMRSGMLRSIGNMGLAVKSTDARQRTGRLSAADVAQMIKDEKAKKNQTEGK
jgi:hypothetical protein